MNPMQERALRPTLLVDTVHHIGMGSGLGVPRFDHESRVDYRDGNDPMMSDLDPREALGDRAGTRQRRSTDANDSEETAGGILNSLLHILAEVMHLCRLGVWADSWSHIRRSMSYTNGGKFGS